MLVRVLAGKWNWYSAEGSTGLEGGGTDGLRTKGETKYKANKPVADPEIFSYGGTFYEDRNHLYQIPCVIHIQPMKW